MANILQIVNSALVKIGAPLTNQASYDAGKTKEDRVAAERLDHLRLEVLRSHPWNFAIKRANAFTITATGNYNVNATPASIPVSPLDGPIESGSALLFSGGGTLTTTEAVANGGTSIPSTIANASVTTGQTCGPIWNNGEAATTTKPNHEYDHSVLLPSDLVRLLDVYLIDKEYRIEGGALLSNTSTPEILYVHNLTDYTKFDPLVIEVLAWRLASEIAYSVTQSAQVIEIASRGYEMSMRRAKTSDAQEDGRYHLEAELFDDSRYGNSIFTDYRNHYRP